MNFPQLEQALDDYVSFWKVSPFNKDKREEEQSALFRKFIASRPDCTLRTCVEGHLTGSALVLDPKNRVLLTLHRKLGKWLQLGGHADGDPKIWEVAKREAEEESGLTDLSYQTSSTTSAWMPLDIDCHEIPANAKEPAHLHLDMRYVFRTDSPDSVQISDESSDLRWFDIRELPTVEESVLRLAKKILLDR